MSDRTNLLRVLVQQRHWQTHKTFCAEYNKVARSIDENLVGSAPSRPQLHRWLSGALATMPHPHHCRVLEGMFPGVSAKQLFLPYVPDNGQPTGPTTRSLADAAISAGHKDPEDSRVTRQERLLLRLESAPWLLDLVDEGVDAFRQIDEQFAGTMAMELCRKAFQDCVHQLRSLRQGHFEAPFDDNWLVYALTERTEERLIATSVEEVDLRWWQSAAGNTYWRLHKEALSRGVQVQRIFIYREWTDEHEELARRQHDNGVRTLRVSSELLSPDLRVDMILWDESCGYESRVNSSGEAITNNYTFAKRDLLQMFDKYKMIELCAEEWPPAQR